MLGLLILLVFLLFGYLLQYWSGLPLPASILGMLSLLLFLLLNRSVPPALTQISRTLSPLLPLFLIPVSVGIVTHKSLLAEHGVLLLGILAVSLIPGVLVCALIMKKGGNHG